MNKLISSGLAALLVSLTSANEEHRTGRELRYDDEVPGFPCQFWVKQYFFDLTGLMKKDGDYSASCTSGSQCVTATWNFCKYSDMPFNAYSQENAFAFTKAPKQQEPFSIKPQTNNVRDPTIVVTGTTKIRGQDAAYVAFTMEASQTCSAGRKRTFTAQVQCDRYQMGQGTGLLVGLPTMDTDGCDLKVVMNHESGCPADNANTNIFGIGETNYPWAANWLIIFITYVINPILWLVLIFQSLSSSGAV